MLEIYLDDILQVEQVITIKFTCTVEALTANRPSLLNKYVVGSGVQYFALFGYV